VAAEKEEKMEKRKEKKAKTMRMGRVLFLAPSVICNSRPANENIFAPWTVCGRRVSIAIAL